MVLVLGEPVQVQAGFVDLGQLGEPFLDSCLSEGGIRPPLAF